MYKIKEYVGKAIYPILAALFLWVAISGIIQRFKCPSLSETEIFLHIPKSFICDWHNCK